MDPSILSALTRSGNLVLSSNRSLLSDFSGAGGWGSRQPTGHLIFYGPHGRRILATDPEGEPLHECEWSTGTDGSVTLVRARLHLDWGQWVGLKPGGLFNRTTLDLSKKSGWERLQADDLRRMAAQAIGVPLEEVRFFYGDDDLTIDPRGRATIRHRKDAFYVLEDGTFHQTRFMACLGAMHWARIDFLPVVELFQSLLPGTGSAAFELIRGLYDDQTWGLPQPLALRYRGIPPYPSEAAFRLFSAFFAPQIPGGGDPLPVFMDVRRAHEVTWLPAPDPPRRYFDRSRKLCVTIKGETVQKVTVGDDQTGLPFVSLGRTGFAPCDRSLRVSNGLLVMKDGETRMEIPVNPAWLLPSGMLREAQPNQAPSYPIDWRALFGGTPPKVSPAEAFAAVPLYPEDGTEIEEASTQPFVADYLQDTVEQQAELAACLARAGLVLINGFDVSLSACLLPDRPRDYTVLYHRAAFAQKQAQGLWNQLAQRRRLDWAKRITLLPAEASRQEAYARQYDLIYEWIPFGSFGQAAKLEEIIRAVAGALKPGGLAFVTGPRTLERTLQAYRLRIIQIDSVETLPSFRMHRTILPNARLKPGLSLFQVAKA